MGLTLDRSSFARQLSPDVQDCSCSNDTAREVVAEIAEGMAPARRASLIDDERDAAVRAIADAYPDPDPAIEQETVRAIAEARRRWGPQAMAWVLPAVDAPREALPRRYLVCPRPGLARGADTFAEAFERAERAVEQQPGGEA